MAILFNRVERANPQNPNVKKWYPTVKTVRQVSEKEVAIEIAEETTLNHKEAEMSLEQLLKVLLRHLLASDSIQLGDWGSFHLTCNGEPCDTKEEVDATKIKNLNIRFSPGKALRNALKNAIFIPVESLVSGS
jgi:predicted histone-like DNA-binding protein